MEKAVQVRSAGEGDEAAVLALWRDCGLVVPYNDPSADFRFARAKAGSDVLVGVDSVSGIIGSVMVGHDGHRGWVYYLSCAPDCRGRGIGRLLMGAAEQWLAERGVRKLQLMVRQSNQQVLGFYQALGYETGPVVVMQKWLEQS
jgi:ribosomal protein S18 acetylase RimI-like enzyme